MCIRDSGVVAATDKTYLLETLARWILDRTDQATAFAAHFAFMRIAAANRIITSCAVSYTHLDVYKRQVYKQMLTELDAAGVKPIECVGQEFDPDFHNACLLYTSPGF